MDMMIAKVSQIALLIKGSPAWQRLWEYSWNLKCHNLDWSHWEEYKLFFLPKTRKLGTKVVILLNKIALKELKAGQSKAWCKIFSILFLFQFLHMSVLDSPLTKLWEFRIKNLFPAFVPFLKWRCLLGLKAYFKSSLKTFKKSRIRETKHLSSDAHSSIDAIGGCTKNTPKPDFFEKQKKSSRTEKLKKRLEICQICDTLFDQRSLIHREAWFPGGPRIPKSPIFFKNGRKSSKTQKLKNV